MAAKHDNIDDYVASFPKPTRVVLEELRRLAHAAAPGAEEAISYAIPTLRRDGHPLLHFAGWSQHVSIYPVPEADAELRAELAPYAGGQGTLRFPLSEPMPYDLVGRVFDALVAERS